MGELAEVKACDEPVGDRAISTVLIAQVSRTTHYPAFSPELKQPQPKG